MPPAVCLLGLMHHDLFNKLPQQGRRQPIKMQMPAHNVHKFLCPLLCFLCPVQYCLDISGAFFQLPLFSLIFL